MARKKGNAQRMMDLLKKHRGQFKGSPITIAGTISVIIVMFDNELDKIGSHESNFIQLINGSINRQFLTTENQPTNVFRIVQLENHKQAISIVKIDIAKNNKGSKNYWL